jgi:hypothetical protein
MNLTQETALLALTGKQQPDAEALQKLDQLIQDAPYFVPARMLQLGLDKSKAGQAPITALYISNAWWLRYQLDEMAGKAIATAAAPLPISIPTLEEVQVMSNPVVTATPTEPATTEPADSPEAENTEPENKEPAIANTGNKLSSMLSEQLADFKKPLEPDAILDIDIEKRKLFTIDYFASQGIKIDLSAIPQDKLTSHLLKFTDWLRQIKSGQLANGELPANPEMEKAVAADAQISNEAREVLTEAMADVLVKQGQIEKAIQLYIKLSFTNPEKSSYFAARIEQLKGI